MDNSGVPASPSGSHASHDAVPSSPSVSIPNAEAFAHLVVDWASVPSYYFNKRYPFFDSMLKQAMVDYDLAPTETLAASAFVFVEIAEMLDAQAIEARRAEMRSSSVHESAVTK